MMGQTGERLIEVDVGVRDDDLAVARHVGVV
jgi:hypothetical protein